jgi:Lon protease-like protein
MASHSKPLPEVLPIFPLTGALLLPGCRLPLNIFEPRYLQMVRDALAGDRMIGLIQPFDPRSEEFEPALQRIGCVGRITSMKETDDGHNLISLVGISRFEVVSELPGTKLYRTASVSWERFASDRQRATAAAIDRDDLVAKLRVYFETSGLEANWDAIDGSGDEELVDSLAMVCPFDPTEKQALLEARDTDARGQLVIALMNMAVLQGGAPETLH